MEISTQLEVFAQLEEPNIGNDDNKTACYIIMYHLRISFKWRSYFVGEDLA